MIIGADDVHGSETPPDDRTVVAQEVSAGAGERRAPRRDVSLEPGDILNGIYRVDRFIARGGMGEVFEGVNVESDERVAIKAMRSHLAADPKVLAMFRKEAQVLTRIAHPAIVQYRVLARDPELDLYYIVTDFIDGEPLSAHLDGTRPSIAAILRFARRLASGLEAAHEYGAIHRDMSPDNILLPGGVLERAKIIDFGIAKSLDVTAETVVGDGFAGKLGYVAPEQFGDYDRQVGPWTDVYSTALVLLAFARGKTPDMGKTLSEAIERRREGPDLANLPAPIAPLLRRMLAPDPRERIRSMAEVLAELDRVSEGEEGPEPVDTTADAPQVPDAAVAPTEPPASPNLLDAPLTTFLPGDPLPQPKPVIAPPPAPAKLKDASKRPSDRPTRSPRRWIGVALAVPILAGGGFALLHRAPPAVAPAPVPAPAPVIPSRPANPVPAPHPTGIAPLLKALPCAWLQAHGSEGALRLSGGARDPAALDDQVTAAARTDGMALPSVNSADVVQIPEARCDLVEAARGFEPAGDVDAFRLVSPTSLLTLRPSVQGCPQGLAARTDLTVVETDPHRDFALFSILPNGAVHLLVSGRKQFATLAGRQSQFYQDLGDGRFQISACYGTTGAVGLVLVDAAGPVDLGLSDGFMGQPPAGFADRIRTMAAAQGWRTRSVWLRIDIGSSGLAAPVATPPAPAVPAATGPVARAIRADSATPPAPVAFPAVSVESLRPAFKEHDGATSSSDFAACRRWDGKQWTELGYSSRAACVERVFKNRCEISNGQFGDTPLRRYGERIEMQRGSRWAPIATGDNC